MTTPRSRRAKPAAEASAPPRMGDRYIAALHAQAAGANGESRSGKTRARIKIAAFECLNERIDLSGITILAVTQPAGIAAGTFYLHFDGTRELLLEVFAEFAAADIAPAVPHSGAGNELFLQMKAMFQELVSSFRRRRHLFRSLFQFMRQEEDARRLWLAMTTRWANEIALIAKAYSKAPLPAGFAHVIGHASSAIADEILARIYIDEIFGEAFAEDPGNEEYVAELLAYLRHRVLFGHDPDASLLSERSRSGELVPTLAKLSERPA